MAKGAKSQEFMKAHPFLLERTDLTSAEKLVMIVVGRFWPNPYWGTNIKISKELGFTERYIEKVVKSLADKGVIKRGYAHTTKNGRPHTVRVIAPLCFSEKCKLNINWIKPEHTDGQQTEHIGGGCPNNSSFLPEQSDDLLEKNRQRNRKATPTPLPAGGQAPALLDNQENGQQTKLERLKAKLGLGGRKTFQPLSKAKFKRCKQKQIKALLQTGK